MFGGFAAPFLSRLAGLQTGEEFVKPNKLPKSLSIMLLLKSVVYPNRCLRPQTKAANLAFPRSYVLHLLDGH